MNIVEMRLSDLTPAERNVRRHNANQIKEFKKSLDTFGVIRPLVVDENGVILCGNGLYNALLEQGADTADCIIMSGLTERSKKKLMLADNKVFELGTSDYEYIDEILTELGQDGDFFVPGYNEDFLEDMYGIRSVEQSAPSEIARMSMHHEQTEEQPKPVPSTHLQEEREKAMQRRIIICPRCGETIEL